MNVVSELSAQCHCVNCSKNNECLSRGQCNAGYWGDNCMLYDILSIADEREQTVHITNSSTFSENNILVLTNCFLNRRIYGFLIMIRDFSIELNNDIPSWLEH